MSEKRAGLEFLLEPFASDVFLRQYLGQGFLRVPGDPEKCAHLLTWSALNDILEHYPFNASQLRLVRDNRVIPFETFSSPRSQKLGSKAVTSYLRGGATLIIERIDEIHEPLTHLARCLERDLDVPVAVNMYATFAGQVHLVPYWDLSDSFRIQVAGSINWQVQGQTYRFPCDRRPDTMNPPTEEPLWQGPLSAGDVLYQPRGWWFGSSRCDEPTIHLAIYFTNPTGLTLVRRLIDVLMEKETVRLDVPRFADEATRKAYMNELRSVIIEVVSSQKVLDGLLSAMNTEREVRPAFGLPWSATDRVIPHSNGHIELIGTRPLDSSWVNGDESVETTSDGVFMRFDKAAGPLISHLYEKGKTSVDEFLNRFRDMFEAEELMSFLRYLAEGGVISVKSEHPR